MRELKIKRMKSFVACGVRDKVYIEDYDNPDTKINKIPCRKLGKLKNGEEKIFEIDNNAARLFVISDKLSKNYSNDIYPIPAGYDDVVVCGTNQYNPFVGNPFRFYGVDENEEVIKHRKSNLKKGILSNVIIFVVVFALCFLIAFASSFLLTGAEGEPYTFSDEGMSVTLTDNYWESEAEGFTLCYETMDTAVYALREGFFNQSGLENYSVDDYAQLIIENSYIDDENTEVQHKDGLTYFIYDYTDDYYELDYKCFTCVFKTTNAFWAVEFEAYAEDFEEYLPHFEEFAKSVQFAG